MRQCLSFAVPPLWCTLREWFLSYVTKWKMRSYNSGKHPHSFVEYHYIKTTGNSIRRRRTFKHVNWVLNGSLFAKFIPIQFSKIISVSQLSIVNPLPKQFIPRTHTLTCKHVHVHNKLLTTYAKTVLPNPPGRPYLTDLGASHARLAFEPSAKSVNSTVTNYLLFWIVSKRFTNETLHAIPQNVLSMLQNQNGGLSADLLFPSDREEVCALSKTCHPHSHRTFSRLFHFFFAHQNITLSNSPNEDIYVVRNVFSISHLYAV